MTKEIKFADIFAGMGGMRAGFERACARYNVSPKCVFTSEIKEHAVAVLKQNYPDTVVFGDIRSVDVAEIPDFDVLLGGFPCQSFSRAGSKQGFDDTRGTLFFELARILKSKKPSGFIFENVPDLIVHDREKKSDKIGKTFQTILNVLTELGYHVSYSVLNSKEFGVPQERKRVYIVGLLDDITIDFSHDNIYTTVENILESGLKCENNKCAELLLSKYSVKELYGKAITDKRGGDDNIHSWDINYFGEISKSERQLLNLIMTKRRNKIWAEMWGIDFVDGMPLSMDMIRTFFDCNCLELMLNRLVSMGYLIEKYPKKNVNGKYVDITSLPMGYDICNRGFKFGCKRVLDPNGTSITLTATDMSLIFVPDGDNVRPLSKTEGLRMFGFADSYKMDNVTYKEQCDLLGNTVVVPVIDFVSTKLIEYIIDCK